MTEQPAPRLLVDVVEDLHGSTYRILGYCVMPDHVHLLAVNHDGSIPDLVRLFKGRSAAVLRNCGRRGVWQPDYYDHVIRRSEDLATVLRYILENPVRKTLVDDWKDYPWCGSFQWPCIDALFFEAHPNDVLWSDAVPAS